MSVAVGATRVLMLAENGLCKALTCVLNRRNDLRVVGAVHTLAGAAPDALVSGSAAVALPDSYSEGHLSDRHSGVRVFGGKQECWMSGEDPCPN